MEVNFIYETATYQFRKTIDHFASYIGIFQHYFLTNPLPHYSHIPSSIYTLIQLIFTKQYSYKTINLSDVLKVRHNHRII